MMKRVRANWRARSVLSASLIAAGAACALADRWGSPPAEQVSPDGEFVLQNNWDNRPSYETPALLTLKRREGAGWKTLWSRPSPVSPSPVETFFAADGRVVFADRWGRAGFDDALVFVDPKGHVEKRYKLADLFPGSTILLDFQSSLSSIWWRQTANLGVTPDGRHFFTAADRFRIYDLASGKRVLDQGEVRAERDQLVPQFRTTARSKDEFESIRAIDFLGQASDTGSIPFLENLVSSRQETVNESKPSTDDFDARRYHALQALNRLLGDRAPDFFERLVTNEPMTANPF